MPNPTPKILIICGPTASGKTNLALSIADKLLLQHLSVNILSADSRQVYQSLDIVTGKDIPQDLSPNINFFGLDLVEPHQVYNLADFVSYAQNIIQSSIKEQVPLIIVGGTGLYLKAITSDLLNVHVPPNQPLRHDLEKLDLPSLQSRLLAINPQKFESLNNYDLHNPRRLIRAIEIASSLTTPVIASEARQSIKTVRPYFHWIGLRQEKEALKEKIRQRVLNRLITDAIEEVEKLMEKYPDHHLPIFTSLGVKEIVQYLKKDITREKLIDSWTNSEIDYARRQMVWFQKQPDIFWYDKSTVDASVADKLAEIYK